MTIGKYNKQYIEYVVKLASSIGIDMVNVGPIKLTGRASDKEVNILDPNEIYDTISQITLLRRKYKTKIKTFFDVLDNVESWLNNNASSLLNKKSCAAGIEVAVVNPEGRVYGCTVSPAASVEKCRGKELFTSGTINEDDFMDIWLDSNRWKVPCSESM